MGGVIQSEERKVKVFTLRELWMDVDEIFLCRICRVLCYASGLVGGLCWHCRNKWRH